MGCCLSTKQSPKSNPDSHFSKSASNGGSFPPLRPPPPPEEETVVKEVLSETPIPKPPTSIQIQSNNYNKKQFEIEEEEEVRIESTAVIKSTPIDEIVSEISEVSEMYSFTESFSTNTVTEKREDDGEVTQILKSPAKPLRRRPGRGALSHRSPARRAAPSPERRGQITSRSVSVQSRTAAATQRRNVGPPNKIRRDSGEVSGRRSESPATRGDTAAVSRAVRHESPVGTTASRSGGRTPAATSENDGKVGKGGDGVSPETGEIESLENPLVSFECFIFL